MAHQGLSTRFVALAALSVGGAACGSPPEPKAPPTGVAPQPALVDSFPEDPAKWPKFHSVRFRMSVPLPDGKAWRIDDHTHQELTATHAPSSSRLLLVTWDENELMNRERCEQGAKNRGYVPDKLVTVEDAVTVGPEAFDTRVWVAVKPGKDANAPVEGHVMAFGAFVRRCLFVDFRSDVPTGKDEQVLSNRLALVKVKLLGGLTLDAPRTTPDAPVVREKPEQPKVPGEVKR